MSVDEEYMAINQTNKNQDDRAKASFDENAILGL